MPEVPIPSGEDDTSVTADDTAAAADDPPAAADDPPAAATDTPAAADDAPAAGSGAPAASTGSPRLLHSLRKGSDDRYEEFDEELGHGSYGRVVAGRSLSDNKPVAIKFSTVLSRTHITDEVKALEWVRSGGGNPNVIKLLDVARDEVVSDRDAGYPPVKIILERHDMTVQQWLDMRPAGENNRLPIEVRGEITRQIYHGLSYIHEKGIHHQDLYLKNILLAVHEGCIKIADFGAAAIYSSGHDANVVQQNLCNELYRVSTRPVTSLWLEKYFQSRLNQARSHFTSMGVAEEDLALALDIVYNRPTAMCSSIRFQKPWDTIFADRANCIPLVQEVFTWAMSHPKTFHGCALPERFTPALMCGFLLGPLTNLTASHVSALLAALVSQEVRDAAQLYIRSGVTSSILDE